MVVKLLEPVTARYVRFIPTNARTLRVMRAELYGCMAEPIPPYDGKVLSLRLAVSQFPFHKLYYSEMEDRNMWANADDKLFSSAWLVNWVRKAGLD